LGTAQWELYDLEKDPTELNDLSKKQSKQLKLLVDKWDSWSKTASIYPSPYSKKD
jgi:arylsulfatase